MPELCSSTSAESPMPTFNRMLADMPERYPHFIRLLCTRVRAAFAFIE
jgi:hypothetical protein